MELVDISEAVALIVTYLSFLSGAKVCYEIYQSKTCGCLSVVPFLAGISCTLLWLHYSFIADVDGMLVVNCVGLTCQLIYLTFFIVYSKSRKTIIKQTLIATAMQVALFWYIHTAEDNLHVSGMAAAISSVVACSSPLSTVQDVIKSKNVSSMPFPIVLSSFTVSLSWLIFGYLVKDNFLLFSNALTTSISAMQLSLFVIYPSKRPYDKLSPSNKKSVVSSPKKSKKND